MKYNKKEKANKPESGSELKSPQRRSWTLDASDLWPGLNDWPAWSRIDLSSLPSIIVWMSLTSQNSGSQCRWAVHTKMGCCTCAGSDGRPTAESDCVEITLICLGFVRLICWIYVARLIEKHSFYLQSSSFNHVLVWILEDIP